MICPLAGLAIVKKAAESPSPMIWYLTTLKKVSESVANSAFPTVWPTPACWETRVVVMGFCHCGALLFLMTFMVSLALLSAWRGGFPPSSALTNNYKIQIHVLTTETRISSKTRKQWFSYKCTLIRCWFFFCCRDNHALFVHGFQLVSLSTYCLYSAMHMYRIFLAKR